MKLIPRHWTLKNVEKKKRKKKRNLKKKKIHRGSNAGP